MHKMRRFLAGAVVAVASVVAIVPAVAQELVSVAGQAVPLRTSPAADGQVLWQLAQGYPLQVLARQGEWVKVQDFEGDQGWVAQSATQPAPHHVVRVRSANLRSGPGMDYPVVGTAAYGQVLVTQFRRAQWVRVLGSNGQPAWVARSLLWGW